VRRLQGEVKRPEITETRKLLLQEGLKITAINQL